MSDSPNLRLPYIEAAQAQKHVTHNEALRALDAIVQLSVLDRDLTLPPAEPADGDRYLVATGASGDWSGKDGQIAVWQDGGWIFYAPRAGWLCWVADENLLLAWDGAVWRDAGTVMGGVAEAETFGINATADDINRLALASDSVLFNHDGAGHRLSINKHAAADTGSVLFQTGFSGRAEMGLAGSDDCSVKVSADGVSWNDAIVIDRATGEVNFPNTSISGGGLSPSQSIDVYLSAPQTPPVAQWTKVAFDTKVSDPDDVFDAVTDFRFQPTIAGTYLCIASVSVNTDDGTIAGAAIAVNGVMTRLQTFLSGGNAPATPAVTALVSLNGTTDYVEALGYSNDASTPKFNVNATQTFFQAVRLFLTTGVPQL